MSMTNTKIIDVATASEFNEMFGEVPAKVGIAAIDLTGLNVSQKIRKLDASGFSRSEIAKFLDKRYQHVRNVLITPINDKK
jgi:hypothetical protein